MRELRGEAADVVVVGGGPAGSATAIHLARRGVRVLLLDRSRFPRRKPCAECLSPEASRPLAALGVLDGIEARDIARIGGWKVRAPDGATLTGSFTSGHAWTPPSSYGIAVRRELLDAALLDAARRSGATVAEGVRCTGLLRDGAGRVRRIEVLSPDGERAEIVARLVVGADGLRSIVARRCGLARTSRWPRRMALVSHWSGIAGLNGEGELFADNDGYAGIAMVDRQLANVAVVIPANRAKELSGNPGSFAREWILSRPYLKKRFAGARQESKTMATGPFASHSRHAWSPGVALVGDAADFLDPFTGEGVYAALRGAELLSEALAARTLPGELLPRSERALDGALADYDRARRDTFRGKWKVERIIAAAVASPALMNLAVRALSRRRDLADLLVGVTGDFVPAREILRPSYVASLLGAALR